MFRAKQKTMRDDESWLHLISTPEKGFSIVSTGYRICACLQGGVYVSCLSVIPLGVQSGSIDIQA